MLNRNALASLVAPRLQDELATFRFHARTKAVRLGAAPVVGLVCSLWHSVVLLKTFDCSIAARRPSILALHMRAQLLRECVFLVVEMKKS